MTIGERIKQRRMELGLSVDEVAEKLGKNRATVYRYESNEIENLPVGTLEPLAKILETTPAQLMGWEDEEQDENYRRIFARNLNKFLEINGKNQADIATLLNVSQAAVSNWCKGIKIPRMGKVQALADYFGINKSDLLDDKPEQHEKPRGVKIPVLGDVAAGIPIEAIEDIIDYEEIDEDLARRGDFFGLRIKGNSMSPRIQSGDVVIVRVQSDAENGDIVIAKVNGDDACCKKLLKHNDGITLLSFNQDYEPLSFNKQDIASLPVSIIGKVVELRGKF